VDAQIDNTVNNPANVDVAVTLPINTGVNVMVYFYFVKFCQWSRKERKADEKRGKE
jgi:hypothetical protein